VYTKGGVLLFALGASLMGWSSIDPRGLAINRVFGSRPLAFVGQISYGLYLYHWPVHLWLRPDVPQPALGFLQFVVTFALAVVSFRSLEAPILQETGCVACGRTCDAAVAGPSPSARRGCSRWRAPPRPARAHPA
ncbi:hypothetical protein GRW11_25880, partial [Escherichia coli]|nr:hypothetical protein [Escherichia coli]